MQYLITWIEGDEVGYSFCDNETLPAVETLIDLPCTLAELDQEQLIDNVEAFLKEKKSD